jgi:basic membrane lipoprotein Med (substrate-binding protein (PBP1-ABC) superfamily)
VPEPYTLRQSLHDFYREFSTGFHTLQIVFLTVAIGACGPSKQGNSSETPATASAFRVALLTPGSISDQSWNGGAYQGLLRIRDSLSASVSHIQTKTPAEFEENFRQYGNQGYNLVFGHGFEFQDAARAVGPSYPKTQYVITSGNTASGNVSGMVFGFAEPSYLAGIVAGVMTRTNRLGVVGGTELPPVRESFRAFEAGVHSVNPAAKVVTRYIGNWDDVSAGKEQALAQLASGVDVIFQNADAAGLGIFQAVREAKHAYIFGTNSNQNELAPEVTIGSVAIDLPHAFLTVARAVRDHTFKPGIITLGMREQVVELVLNPRLVSRIPAATQRVVDSTRALILAGKFNIPKTIAAAR